MSVPVQLDTIRSAWEVLAKSPALMLYVGPDQIMPLTSALGAIAGIALMFWNRIVGVTMRCWSAMTRIVRAPRTGPAD